MLGWFLRSLLAVQKEIETCVPRRQIPIPVQSGVVTHQAKADLPAQMAAEDTRRTKPAGDPEPSVADGSHPEPQLSTQVPSDRNSKPMHVDVSVSHLAAQTSFDGAETVASGVAGIKPFSLFRYVDGVTYRA